MSLRIRASFMVLAISACNGFQIETERMNLYKGVVEKTLETSNVHPPPPLEIVDDCSYPPHIPLLKSCSHAPSQQSCNTPVARPLSDILPECSHLPPARNAKARKSIGLDEDPAEYWFDNRIHTFGNTGLFGGLHAAVAPLATKIIDDAAYRGFDVRTLVSEELRKLVGKSEARVLDLCCGVGISTRALHAAFHDAEAVIGIDTSPEMLAMAKFITNHENIMKSFVHAAQLRANSLLSHFSTRVKLLRSLAPKVLCPGAPTYARGNAERTIFPEQSFDLVTVMYAFHEIPKVARYRILREARRVLRQGGTLAVIDIAPEYTPSATMLAGEPYVLEYKENIHNQLQKVRGFANFQHFDLVPGHVNMWLLTCSNKNRGKKLALP